MQTRMNYHHLYYFKMIATEGSIAKAAKILRLGHPTLSTQLKQFEENLGKKLFERRHRLLVLTETGKTVLEYANEIFRLGNEMTEAVNDRLVKDRVHIQIGALDSVPKHIIMKLAKAAYAAGECSISILEGKGEELLRELHGHRIDLLLTNVHPPTPEKGGLVIHEVARMPVIVCGTEKFKGLKKGFPQSLQGQPMVMPLIHGKLRHDVSHFLDVHKISIDVIAETQDTSVQKLFGIEGIGLIPIVKVAVADLLDTNLLLEIGTLEGVFEHFWIAAAQRRVRNPIADVLLKSFEFSL